MFAATKMHTFAVDLVLQIIRNAHGTTQINDILPGKDFCAVEKTLHEHWFANNKIQYIKTLREITTTPGNHLVIPERCCTTVQTALAQMRDHVEIRSDCHLGLLEAKHIADIVWANATNDDGTRAPKTLGELLKEQLSKGFPEQ